MVIHRTVRSLSRGLDVIRILNEIGPSTVQIISRQTGLNRTTCYRLLHTLDEAGFVSFDAENAIFSLTAKVRSLSDGVSVADLSRKAALPPMFALLKEVSWPSDFAVLDRGSLIVRESTHAFSPFSINRSMVGRTRSLVRSSLGFAVLSAVTPAQRRQMLEINASLNPADAHLANDQHFINEVVSRTRADGYASFVGQTGRGISGIAVPIKARSPVLGSINIAFFTSAMTPVVAAKRFLQSLKKAASEIEARWIEGTT